MVHEALTSKLCEIGYFSACFNGGMLLAKMGEKEKAKTTLHRGCENRDAESCSGLSTLFYQAQDSKGGIKLTAKACALLSGYNCRILANSISQQEAPEVKVLMNFGCELGDEDACKKLGRQTPKL